MILKSIKEILVKENDSIRDAITKLDKSAKKIVLVTDGSMALLGTITDGDIRRAILKGIHTDEPVSNIMNCNPITAKATLGGEEIFDLMKNNNIYQIPIVDNSNVLVGLETIDEYLQVNRKNNFVILMAGGLGTRLRPLTNDCPKPMLKIGDKPILEIIITNFIGQGFHNFIISVNYKADVIINYFEDGSRFGVNIKYVRETEKMGTAGALSLIEEKIDLPYIVMNADLLTKVNFNDLLEYHNANKSSATMCVREYDFKVPYGVLQLDNYHVVNIEEKPVQKIFINAGIYVMQWETISKIPKSSYCDMPSVFMDIISRKEKVSAFPIREYWLDIGAPDDYHKASGEFKKLLS